MSNPTPTWRMLPHGLKIHRETLVRSGYSLCGLRLRWSKSEEWAGGPMFARRCIVCTKVHVAAMTAAKEVSDAD